MKPLALILATLLTLLGCEKKEPQPAEKQALSVSPASIQAGHEGGEFNFTIICSTRPYIVGNYDWCSYKSGAFANNCMNVTLTVKENKDKDPRTADFSLVCGDEKAKLILTQEGNPKTEPDSGPDPLDPLAFLDAPEQIPTNSATAIAAQLGLGWNLGNQMDAFDKGVASETCWGQPKCTQQTFDKLKSYGFRSVRIPITWVGHIGPAPDYKIDEAWLNRVAEIVGYAEKAGLNCIINTHHDENHHNQNPEYQQAFWLDVLTASINPQFNETVKSELAALWGQIAERFKDKGDWLIFEPFNELNDGGWGWSAAFKANPAKQTGIVNEWNQVFVDAVRSKGGKNADRWLCVIGYAANSELTLQYLKLPKDSAEKRLMVGVHCYDPSEYCINAKFSEWGHNGLAGKKSPQHDERSLVTLMKQLYETYILNDIPCYFGEFGCVNRDDLRSQAFQKYYLEFFCRAARDYSLPCFVWDNGNNGNGERFGYVNHGTGETMAQGGSLVPVMVKGRSSNQAGYTLRSVYQNAPK